MVPFALQPNARVAVVIVPQTGNLRMVRLAEVRWPNEGPDGMFRVGCCWDHRLTFGELQHLI